jgi:hypothetical protein
MCFDFLADRNIVQHTDRYFRDMQRNLFLHTLNSLKELLNGHHGQPDAVEALAGRTRRRIAMVLMEGFLRAGLRVAFQEMAI